MAMYICGKNNNNNNEGDNEKMFADAVLMQVHSFHSCYEKNESFVVLLL